MPPPDFLLCRLTLLLSNVANDDGNNIGLTVDAVGGDKARTVNDNDVVAVSIIVRATTSTTTPTTVHEPRRETRQRNDGDAWTIVFLSLDEIQHAIWEGWEG